MVRSACFGALLIIWSIGCGGGTGFTSKVEIEENSTDESVVKNEKADPVQKKPQSEKALDLQEKLEEDEESRD